MKLRRHLLRYLLFLSLLFIIGWQQVPQIDVEVLDTYEALFTRQKGWTGADGVYSVALSNDTVLWLFGDTWIGDVRDGRHVNASLINNSIAIQHSKNMNDLAVSFYYRRTSDRQPAAFIRPVNGIGWFWPYHGAQTSRGLHLFLMQIEQTDKSSVFGFRLVGTWLGTIANFKDPPADWRIRQLSIPWERYSTDGDLFFGSAVLPEGEYLYIYGVSEERKFGNLNKNMIVARVAENRLTEFDQWRFYGQGHWKQDWRDAEHLCGQMANEYSVSFLPSLKRYVVVYTENGISQNIVARLGSKPHGPWGDPIRLYQCPEAEWHPSIVCYAAKAHPELSAEPNELIVTYVTNSADFQQVTDDARLYRPRFLRVKFEVDK